MEESYAKFLKDYNEVRKDIYEYCDFHRGEVVLFPDFLNSVNNKVHVSKKDLTLLVSDVLDNLIDRKILKISEDPGCGEANSCRETPYAFYEILEHKNLVQHNAFIDKKMKLLSM